MVWMNPISIWTRNYWKTVVIGVLVIICLLAGFVIFRINKIPAAEGTGAGFNWWRILGLIGLIVVLAAAIAVIHTGTSGMKARIAGLSPPIRDAFSVILEFLERFFKGRAGLPAIVFAIWFAYLLFASHFFPDTFRWLWGDKWLTYSIPTIISIIVGVYKVGKLVPSLMVTVLLGGSLVFGVSLSFVKSYVSTDGPKEVQISQTQRQVGNENLPALSVDIVAKSSGIPGTPGEWTEWQEIPGEGWRFVAKPDGEVNYETDLGKKGTDGPGKLSYAGDEGANQVRYQSLEMRDVNIKITLVSKM